MTTARFRSLLAATLVLLAAAGCSKPTRTATAHAAGGEVLPGTISDAMLDPERSQAQAPLQAIKVSGPKVEDFVGGDASAAAAPTQAPVAPPAKPDAKPAAN